MEGLLPMVYKAIRRNRTRRQYRCLSTGWNYYAFDDHHDDQDHDWNDKSSYDVLPTETLGGFDEKRGHRRFASTGGYAIDGGYDLRYNHESNYSVGTLSSPSTKQLKRFRSHRMFACITGAT